MARIVAGLAIAAVSLYLAVREVSWGELRASISGAQLSLVALALASVGLNNLGKAVRWKGLMDQKGNRLSVKRSVMIVLAAQALNTIYPARVGDVGRAYAGRQMGTGGSFTLGTLVVEKLLDIFSYVGLFLILFVLMPLPGWVNRSALSFAVAALVGLGLILLLVTRLGWMLERMDRITGWLPEGIHARIQGWLRDGVASLAIFRDRGELLKVALWSAFIWGSAVLTNHLTLRALDIHLPVTAPMLVLLVLQIGLTLPSVPGGLGVIEYLCILALAVYGIPQARALGFGVLLHVIILLPQTLIGLVFVGALGIDRRSLKSQPADHMGTQKFDPSPVEAAVQERKMKFSSSGKPE